MKKQLLFFLALGCFLWGKVAAQTCDFTIDNLNSSLNLGPTANFNANTGFSMMYFLLNQSGTTILQKNATGANFTNLTAGFYRIVAVNYSTSNPPTPNPATVPINTAFGFTGGCFDTHFYLSNAGTNVIKICNPSVCLGQPIEVGGSHYGTTSGLLQKYVMVCGGLVSAISTTGNFGTSTNAMNGCSIFMINHDNTLSGLTVGAAFPGGLGGCFQVHSASKAVTIFPLPTAIPGANSPICAGQSATLNGSASGGTSPYSFAWNNGGTQGGTVSPSSATTYTLTVTDSKGCQGTGNRTISVNALPVISTINFICGNSDVDVVASGGVLSQFTVTGVTPSNASYTLPANFSSSVVSLPGGTTGATFTVTNANTCVSLPFAMNFGCALPADGLNLTGYTNSKSNELKWTTETEVNTQWHILERSLTGENEWVEVAREKAAGNTQTLQTYSKSDNDPAIVSHYRVRTLDTDGLASYSNVLTLTRNDGALAVLDVFPIPTSDALVLTLACPAQSQLSLTVADAAGKVLWEQNGLHPATGLNTYTIDMRAIASGVYVLKINDGWQTLTRKVIKE